jgi:hypothetical protein
MMGRLKSDQGPLFNKFRLGEAVPKDHMARQIDTALRSVLGSAANLHPITGTRVGCRAIRNRRSGC